MEATGIVRWAMVSATLLVVAGTVRPLLFRDYSIPVGVEEVRMFRITDTRTVQISVPADTQFVELQMVSVVPAGNQYDPAREHTYAFDATLRSTEGETLHNWTVDAASRVSLEHFPQVRGDRRGAELVGSPDWLTDARTITFPVGPLVHRRNALLTLRARGRAELLVRGFSVRHVRNRMTVTGTRGRDYELRRVRVSTYRRSMDSRRRPARTPSPTRLLAGDRMVLNVRGVLDLGLESTTDCVFQVVDGLHLAAGASTELRLSGGMESSLRLPDRGLRSVAFEAEAACSLFVRTNGFDATSLVDVVTEDAGSGRVYIIPKRHYADWAVLDPSKPVVSRVEKGERRIKVTLRRIRTAITEDRRRRFDARAVIVMADGTRVTKKFRKAYRWSAYEHVADVPLSVAESLTLTLPTNADRVELFGDGATLARFAVESGLPDDLAPPYDSLAPPGALWFGAPKRSSAWAPIVPSNWEALGNGKRVRAMSYQIRLLPDGSPRAAGASWLATLTGSATPGRGRGVDGATGAGTDAANAAAATGGERHAPIAASELLPVGEHPVERILVQEDPKAGRPAGDVASAWVRVDRGRDVVVRARDGGMMSVVVRVPPAALGAELRVIVDGQALAKVRATTTTQDVRLRVAPGRHHVGVDGLPEAATAYVDAAAFGRGAVMRRRSAVALNRGETLTYQIPKTQDGRVAVLFQFVSAKLGESWVVPWNVFVNEGVDRAPRLFATGSVEGEGGHDKVALLWDQFEASVRAGWGEGRVILGAPKEPTVRTLRIRMAGGSASRVWVRAVLFGKPTDGPRERVSMERRSDP